MTLHDFRTSFPDVYLARESETDRPAVTMSLDLTRDHWLHLMNLGESFDARTDEVLRAVLHLVLGSDSTMLNPGRLRELEAQIRHLRFKHGDPT